MMDFFAMNYTNWYEFWDFFVVHGFSRMDKDFFYPLLTVSC